MFMLGASTQFSNIASICNQFGCKFWLRLIQNHPRHRLKAFARLHLKLMCCSIWIWAHALSSDRSSIWIYCFAHDSIWNMQICPYALFLFSDLWMIEKLSETIRAALVSNKFSWTPSKLYFTRGKNSSSRPKIYKALKHFWLLNWVSITRVVGRSPQASRYRPAVTVADSENAMFVLARPRSQNNLYGVWILLVVFKAHRPVWLDRIRFMYDVWHGFSRVQRFLARRAVLRKIKDRYFTKLPAFIRIVTGSNNTYWRAIQDTGILSEHIVFAYLGLEDNCILDLRGKKQPN